MAGGVARLAAVAVAVGTLAGSTSAHANGRFPSSSQILFSPTHTDWVMVRGTYGIIFSEDTGTTWRWLCEDVLGLAPTTNEDPYLALTAGDALIVGTSNGLRVSPDTGCSWVFEGGGLQGQLFRDLVVHRDNPHAVDSITSTLGAMANDGAAGYLQQPYETVDDGTTWNAFGAAIDPTAIVTTIDVAPSDPKRVYVSAFRSSGMTRTASLFVSKDRGATWTEHQTPLDPMYEVAVYIGAVDPANEDLVYLRTEGRSRLLVTRDGGQTFTVSQQLSGQMLGFALSEDGATLYLGSVEDGLLAGDTATLAFANTGVRGASGDPLHVQCLATHGSDLWACSDEVSGFMAGISHDGGKMFTPKMHLLSIDAPIACSADASGATCSGPPFASLCTFLGACNDGGPTGPLDPACKCTGACIGAAYDASATCPDGGASSSGATDGGGHSTSPTGGAGSSTRRSSCGCSVIGGGGALGLTACGALLALVAGRRMRRRRGRFR